MPRGGKSSPPASHGQGAKEPDAMNLHLSSHSNSPTDQAPIETDAMRHWAARRREMLLEDRLDRLTTVLERLTVALERRTS